MKPICFESKSFYSFISWVGDGILASWSEFLNLTPKIGPGSGRGEDFTSNRGSGWVKFGSHLTPIWAEVIIPPRGDPAVLLV